MRPHQYKSVMGQVFEVDWLTTGFGLLVLASFLLSFLVYKLLKFSIPLLPPIVFAMSRPLWWTMSVEPSLSKASPQVFLSEYPVSMEALWSAHLHGKTLTSCPAELSLYLSLLKSTSQWRHPSVGQASETLTAGEANVISSEHRIHQYSLGICHGTFSPI